MTEIDSQLTDISLSDVGQYPGKYIPLECVDKNVYEVIHPEHSMAKLGMSARTAYRKMDAGEIEYTFEKGSKRLLVRKSPVLSDTASQSVGHSSPLSNSSSDSLSVMSEDQGHILKILNDYKEMLASRDEEIKDLRQNLDKVRAEFREELESSQKKYQDIIDDLRFQLYESKDSSSQKVQQIRQEYQDLVDGLRSQLEDSRVLFAKTEGQLSNIQKLLETQDLAIHTQSETISNQKSAIDALNNERLVITQQLQKYKSPNNESTQNGDKFPAWMFWKH